jgi:hypothetical protein
VDGKDALAEEAALRVVRFAAPCTPADVTARVEGFVDRFPGSGRLTMVRIWRAKALTEAAGDGADRAARAKAAAAWQKLAGGPGGADAKAMVEQLEAKGPLAPAEQKVCPDPGAILVPSP